MAHSRVREQVQQECIYRVEKKKKEMDSWTVNLHLDSKWCHASEVPDNSSNKATVSYCESVWGVMLQVKMSEIR